MDEGTKRRLPLWMLGNQARNKAETGNLDNINDDDNDDDERSREDEEMVKKHGRRPKARSCEKGNDDGSLKLAEDSSSLLVKCGKRKQTRRKKVSRDVDMNGEVAINKKKCRGRGKKSLEVENNEDDEVCMENGEDEDLTIDDLMSIAKEYVQEDNDAQTVVSSKRGRRIGSRSQERAQSGSSISVPQGNSRSFECQGTSSCSISTENLTSEVADCKPIMSGNPTQDMLDLFLGPLLKKTQEQEKEGGLIADNIHLTYEAKKQHNNALLAEEPVLVKKKSSLKDKVAMFLD